MQDKANEIELEYVVRHKKEQLLVNVLCTLDHEAIIIVCMLW